MKDYDELLIALRRITRAIDLYSNRLQKDTRLTISQLLVMDAIVKIDKPTPSAIAKSILLSQATVTNLIDRLEKNGLVQRKRLGTDKRTINVVLTELGETKYEEAPELLQSGLLREYRKLESWEQHLLVSAVGRVASMMDAEEIDASPILAIGDIDGGEPFG